MRSMAITGSACGHCYDRWAPRYERWWLPVIAPATYRLLDRVAADLEDRSDATLVDVGAGTGILAVAALRRWPRLKVVAVDASRGMLRLAREGAVTAGEAVAGRLTLRLGDAAALPLRDGSADVVVSSFVLQLVPDRTAALADVRRVLRPGGAFAAVTWRRSTETFAPEEAFHEVAEELGFDLPPEAPDGRDFASPASAAVELRRAGFRNVVARDDWLERRWTTAEYLGLLEHWVADDVFEGLTSRQRNRLRTAALARLSRLPPAAFAWRAPLVSIRAAHPGQ
jgi:ubiquinone/menaquinone biosynthesis C-methylase UbiE